MNVVKRAERPVMTERVCQHAVSREWKHAKEVVEHLFGNARYLGRVEFLGDLFDSKDEAVTKGATVLELMYASYYCYNMYVDRKGLNKTLSSGQLLAAARELEEYSLELTASYFGKESRAMMENSASLEYDAFLMDTQPLRELRGISTKLESLSFVSRRNSLMNANTPCAVACIIAKKRGLDPEPYARLAYAYGQVQQIVNDFADIAFWVQNPATREKNAEDIFADFRNGRYTTLSHAVFLAGGYQNPKEVLMSQDGLEAGNLMENIQDIARNTLFHSLALKEWAKKNGVEAEKFPRAFCAIVNLYQSNKYLRHASLSGVRKDLRSAGKMGIWAENHYGSVENLLGVIDASYRLLVEKLDGK